MSLVPSRRWGNLQHSSCCCTIQCSKIYKRWATCLKSNRRSTARTLLTYKINRIHIYLLIHGYNNGLVEKRMCTKDEDSQHHCRSGLHPTEIRKRPSRQENICFLACFIGAQRRPVFLMNTYRNAAEIGNAKYETEALRNLKTVR